MGGQGKAQEGNTCHPAAPVSEGFVPFRGFRTWYRVVGDLAQPGGPAKFPLLVLHGGPGESSITSNPLRSSLTLGARSSSTISWGVATPTSPTTLRCGASSSSLTSLPQCAKSWGSTTSTCLGYSWGGMLAMEYALTQPEGLASLILASSPASIPQWIAEANRLRKELPQEVEQTLRHHEEAGTGFKEMNYACQRARGSSSRRRLR